MANIASWVRENDGQYRFFDRFVEKCPDLRLFNARVEPVDWSQMDGLLLTGGEDIPGEMLHQPVPDPKLIEEPNPARSAWEFEILQRALQDGKPVFAVCKGHQVLNVGLGGTLFLDIPGHDQPEMKMENIQPMRYTAAVPGHQRFEFVNSSHHQAIDRLGDGLEVEAWCPTDEIIEQVRLRGHPFVLGVQYHPERDWLYESLFSDFFDHVLKNDTRQRIA